MGQDDPISPQGIAAAKLNFTQGIPGKVIVVYEKPEKMIQVRFDVDQISVGIVLPFRDNLHRDHIEVFTATGKFKQVLNLDGTINVEKTAKAIGRVINVD